MFIEGRGRRLTTQADICYVLGQSMIVSYVGLLAGIIGLKLGRQRIDHNGVRCR